MSLPLISDTAAEVHRLTIAGSALAAGDFRLQKLLPQLEALGAKAPVFSRIAQGVKAVTEESDAAKAGRALLDLSTLLTAIQYTQSQHGADGEFTPLNTAVTTWMPTVAGYRTLAAVVEALTSTGEGRLEIVRDAAQRGLFKDLRLMQPTVTALSDRFGELADFVADHAIPQFGAPIIPLLKAGFDPKGGNAHARRLRALCAVDKEEGRTFARAALEEARKEVKVAAVEGLAGSAADYETILQFTKDRAEDVRHAAIRALGQTPIQDHAQQLQSMFDGPDGRIALAAAVANGGQTLPESVFDYTRKLVSDPVPKSDEAFAHRRSGLLLVVLRASGGRSDTRTLALLDLLFANRKKLNWDVNMAVAELLYTMNSPERDRMLYESPEQLGAGQHVMAFMAAYRRIPPPELLRLFGAIFEKNGEKSDLYRLLRGWPIHLLVQDSWPALGEKLELDPGWLKLAMKLEAMHVVANLTREGDLAARELLISKERYYSEEQLEFRAAIFRAAPDKAFDYAATVWKAIQKRSAHPYELTRLLTSMAEVVTVDPAALAAFGGSITGKYKEAFEQACAEISDAARRKQA